MFVYVHTRKLYLGMFMLSMSFSAIIFAVATDTTIYCSVGSLVTTMAM
jgi:hypothetical protein